MMSRLFPAYYLLSDNRRYLDGTIRVKAADDGGREILASTSNSNAATETAAIDFAIFHQLLSDHSKRAQTLAHWLPPALPRGAKTPLTTGFEKLRSVPAYRLVVDAIRDEIINGRIKPGERIPSEARLAAQFGVHRSTVREGMRLLEEAGFVIHRPGGKRRYAAEPAKSSDAAADSNVAPALRAVTFIEYWEICMALEPTAAALAARRAVPADVAALADNLERTREAVRVKRSVTQLDREFHHLVAHAAHNRALLAVAYPLRRGVFYPALEVVMERMNADERLLVAHETIFDAIRLHDEARAREWMEKHIVDFRRGYELANLDVTSVVALQ
jgi:GntR family transcriptional regulator, transcriptional repressor for pyruvate dehydrogenase complex